MRRDVVAVARRWLGTPYQHQASCEGAGADCLGLVRGIWREVCGAEPAVVPAYTPDWSEAARDERLLAEMGLYFNAVSGEAQVGDVLVFRLRAVAKHLAVVSARGKIIHAYSGRGVVETQLSAAWDRRIAGGFRFPDRSN